MPTTGESKGCGPLPFPPALLQACTLRYNHTDMRKKFFIILWCVYGVLLLAIGLGFLGIKNGWIGYMPPLDELQSPISRYASQVISSDGKVLGTWSRNENRVYVPYDSISPYVFQALVATEDVRFYEHSGIDGRALGRAIVKRGLMGSKEAGGGSTITQQLAKQLYSTHAQSTAERLMQKPIEWVIAVELEKYYTKNEILTLYLNYFDFLHNAVGIKTAAQVYFGKHPKDLTINEAALLVGMCKNPSYFNPVREPERCLGRRNTVLDQMVKGGYLSAAQAESLKSDPLSLRFHPMDHKEGSAAYLREYLRRILMAKRPQLTDYHEWQMQQYYADSLAWENDPLYGWCNKNFKRDGSPYDIYTDGLKIYTTIDTRMQRYAENAMKKHLADMQVLFEREKRGSANFPYSSNLTADEVTHLLNKAKRQSDRYRMLKNSGASDAEIERSFQTPTAMTVFTYRGEVDTVMTPMDSIRYYKKFLRSGLLSIDPSNGYVKAYVGGMNYTHFQYDMAMVGRRQVGSTMKPFVYAMAMQNGWRPEDEIVNVQRTYHVGNQTWTPRNGSRARYGEPVTLRWGLSQSNNWITAELMYQVDNTGTILTSMLKEFGVANRDIHPSLALCLGTCDITVGEMASAYTAFVNKGLRCAPLLVTRIEDAQGKVYDFTPRMNYVISEESSYSMLDMLQAVVNQGTGRRLRRYGIDAQVAGKTGTTNRNSDGWFIGCVPKLITACWVGGEDRDIHFNSTANGQGAAAALPMWAYYMKSVYGDRSLHISQNDKFKIPEERLDAGETPNDSLSVAPASPADVPREDSRQADDAWFD